LLTLFLGLSDGGYEKRSSGRLCKKKIQKKVRIWKKDVQLSDRLALGMTRNELEGPASGEQRADVGGVATSTDLKKQCC